MATKKTNQSRNVLIVFAHQKQDSFNGALLQEAVNILTSVGHIVEVSDLYAMKFDPVYRFEDFEGGKMPKEVQDEIDKVEKADLLIFQFPLYFSGMPAIMKGWVDKVMQMMSSFERGGNTSYQTGVLKGKKAVLSFTTGVLAMSDRAVDVIVAPVQNGSLQYNGLDILRPQVSQSPEHVDDISRKHALAEWSNRLAAIFDEPVIEMLNIVEWAETHVDRDNK